MSSPDPPLDQALAGRIPALRKRLDGLRIAPKLDAVGIVERVGDGVATVRGLPDACLDELLIAGPTPMMAVALDRETLGCVVLDHSTELSTGDRVHGTGEVVRVPVGDELLGRVIDPLGRPLDGEAALEGVRHDPIERPAPGVVDRHAVDSPLTTGILAVDALTPLGRGQRQLILGDRKTGKTAIAVDAMVSQARTDVICVYCAIGQKSSTVTRVIAAMQEKGAFDRFVAVIAEAGAASALQWIAPYAATTIAEFFRDRGQHVLVVFDDLTQHAAVHREISLLLRSPPGREAYPGDIFHLHARLLERSARLSTELGGGSITALPIVETQGGNLTAYIPTNLVSITDGQIYLEPQLFYEGHKPAVDVGRSVSRVGGRAQFPDLRRLSRSMRLDYAQFLELEMFSRFGAVADERTQTVLERGRRMRAVLTQHELNPWTPGQEVAMLLALTRGVLDPLSLEQIPEFRRRMAEHLQAVCPRAMVHVDEGTALEEAEIDAIVEALRTLAGEL